MYILFARRNNADNTAGNQGFKRSFQGMNKLLHIPYSLLRIEPEEYIDIDAAPGPARTDAVEIVVAVERGTQFS